MQGSIDYNNYNEVVKKLPEYRRDFRLFCGEQICIPTKPPRPRVVPLSPFPPTQEMFVRSMEAQQREIGFIRQVWLKQRQQMGSSAALAKLFHMAAINPYTHTFTAAHDMPTSEILFRTVHFFYESLHPAIRPVTRRSTVRQLVFEDEKDPQSGLHSSMSVDTAKKINVAIGRRLSALHFSEVARYEQVAKGQVNFSMGAALGAVPMSPGTCVILESTAFITGAFFKTACERAKRNEGAWRFVFVPWFVSPEYRVPVLPGERITPTNDERKLIKRFGLTPAQIKFRRFKIAEFHGDEALFQQDFAASEDECWLVSGHCVFPPSSRDKLRRHLCAPARQCEILIGKGVIDVPGGPLWIWRQPEPDGEYDIGVDVALDSDEAEETEDGDPKLKSDEDQNYSVIEVIRRGTLEQVAEWRGRVDPIGLAELAATLGYYYNTAQIAPDSKGIGVATTGHLSTVLRYPNIHRWRHRDKANALTKDYGWYSSPTAKQYLVAFAVYTVGKRLPEQPLIHSTRLFAEIETFVRVGYGQYEAAANCMDDLVSSWLIALVTSNDEDFTRFVSGEEAHQEKVETQFYEPGKAPRRTDVDPAFLDVDADYRSPIGAGSEVDGW